EFIRIRTMVEDNEVLKEIKDETLGCVEILELVKKKCEALAAAQEPHKNRLDELGKLIAQKIDLLEGIMTTMSNIMLVVQNEKGEISQDELESIAVNISEKEKAVLNEWQTLEAEINEEYPELILPIKAED
ncbi:hypothetical protein KI387_028120, partial [Taxus chinensis]